VVGQLLRRLIGFAANLYLLRLLTPEAMGQFVILQFITMLIPQYVGMGLNMAIVKEGDLLPINVRRSAFTFQLFIASILGLIVWLCTDIIHDFYAYEQFITNYLPWMLLLIPILVIKQILISQWQVRLSFIKITTADLVEHLSYLSTAILLCQYLHPLHSLLIAFAFARIISCVYLCVGFLDWKVFLPRFSWRDVRQLISFGSYVQLGSICNLVADAMIPVVLGKLGGPTSVGLVTWAMRVVWIPQSITNFIDGISFSTFCRLDSSKRRFRWILKDLSQAMLAFTGLYLIILNAFYPQIITYVFGEQWQGSRIMIFCLSTYILSYAPCTILVQAIFANNGARFLFKMSVFNMLAIWTIGTTLIYFFKTQGVAYYYLLMNAYSILIYFYGAQLAKFRWQESIVRPFLAIILSSTIYLSYRFLIADESMSISQTAIEAIVLVVLYLGFNYLLWARSAYKHFLNQNQKELKMTLGLNVENRKAG
jgi:O-antigen/teichoic acid export membrane protein